MMRHAFILMIGMALSSASAVTASQPEGDGLPTLDELLGLEEAGSANSIEDPNAAALDQVLGPREAGEALGQAVALMGQVSRRIGEQQDLSISTQRLQEDILRKLDQVIASAENNQQGGGGSSSSSSSSQSSSSAQQPDQQQGQAQSQGGSPGAEPGEAPMHAGTSTARPGDEVAPDGVSWGALPQRLREALSQGFSDQYSELYRAITEQYYRRLAEDGEER